MDLKGLEMFSVLAETLHFRRAAARLGVTQSALTRAIQRLEAEMGVDLFERSRRAVSLTPSGEALREGASDIIGRAKEMTETARSAGRARRGHVVIGACISATQPPVGRWLENFRQENPGVILELRTVEETSIPEALSKGRIHGLIAVDWALPQGCPSAPIYETELVAALPAGSDLASKDRIRPADFDRHRMILPCRREQPMVYDRFRQLASECDVRPEVVADVQSMDQALGLVAGGVACALLPAPPGLKYPGVVLRPFEPAYRLTYCFGWTERDALVEGLIQALPVRAA